MFQFSICYPTIVGSPSSNGLNPQISIIRNRLIQLGIVIVFVLSCLFIFLTPVIAEVSTAIDGKIINGTNNGENVEGLNVRIRYLSGDGNVVELESQTDSGGEFKFPNLSGNEILFYTLETTYLDVLYRVEIDPRELTDLPELVIYEVMGSSDELSVLDHSVVVTGFDRVNQELYILEAVKIENGGNRTFFIPTNTSNPMDFLRFSLPIGASELEVESSSGGGHVIQIDLGFALTIPVPPGEHEILFTYSAPYRSGIWEYKPAMIRGADNYRLMIKKGIGSLAKDPFIDQGEVNVGTELYHLFQQKDLDAGERLSIAISDLPELKFTDHLLKLMSSRQIFLGIIPGIATLAFLVLLYAGVYRRRSSSR